MATYVLTSDKKSHEESVLFHVYFAVYCNHKKVEFIKWNFKFHFLRILEMTSSKFVSIKREIFDLLVSRDKNFVKN